MKRRRDYIPMAAFNNWLARELALELAKITVWHRIDWQDVTEQIGFAAFGLLGFRREHGLQNETPLTSLSIAREAGVE